MMTHVARTMACVALLARAWIEILSDIFHSGLNSTSLSLRERGLKYPVVCTHTVSSHRRSPCESVD